jgi:hypothetical protein
MGWFAVAVLGPDDQFGNNTLSGLGACPALAGSAELVVSRDQRSWTAATGIKLTHQRVVRRLRAGSIITNRRLPPRGLR